MKNSTKHKQSPEVPRHARVTKFNLAFWPTCFQNTANTTKCGQNLEKMLRFIIGRGWRRSLLVLVVVVVVVVAVAVAVAAVVVVSELICIQMGLESRLRHQHPSAEWNSTP